MHLLMIMEMKIRRLHLWLHYCLCFAVAAICLMQYCCDATRTIPQYKHELIERKSAGGGIKISSSNSDPYVSSPFSLPPYESLPPFPSPPDDQNTPPSPYCVYPSPPASTIPTPPAPTLLVPAPPYYTPPPTTGSGSGFLPPPSPTPYYSSPPPSTGSGFLSPPSSSPYSFPPPSRSFLPPIVYPPPAVPPPPRRTPLTAMWCVAKAAVPDPIIQEAMDYACGSGADCGQIQPSGSCFLPNTLFAHASYAFNSYWQRSKVAGGRCDFGGTAILVTVDPSYDGCHFLYL